MLPGLLLLTAGFVALGMYRTRSLPSCNATLKQAESRQPVTIYRDIYGRPEPARHPPFTWFDV
ncbi:hypothetical protein SAMN05443144_11734 [Fodinibius roseus]|uniref:Uncharacterized protein n=1 Tax=Fodinibius roseus TaxID=1194090 RepID=A0A1M5GFE4_9BACT|nr:hypothetical protein [Fodinibius roseus]SHG02418.1 hypothetical protein SAMN05443144_11734 [Fodinibius roseus]